MMAANTDSPGSNTQAAHAQKAQQSDADRRHAPRVLVNLDVDYGNADNYLFANIRDISATGIFVSTNSPVEPGTRLNVRFTPSHNTTPRDTDVAHPDVLDLEGLVMWVNAHRPSDHDSLNPGMGIRFLELNDTQRKRLHDFIKTFAYIDEEESQSLTEAPAEDDA